MARTIRLIKQAHTQAEDIDHSFNCYKAVKEAKANTKENIQLLYSVYGSLSNLCTNVNSLDNLRKNIKFLDYVCDILGNLCINLDSLENLMESLIFCEEKEKAK